jgi:hypothetical protein
MTRGDVLGACTYLPGARPLDGLLGQPATPSGVPHEAGQRADLDRPQPELGFLPFRRARSTSAP